MDFRTVLNDTVTAPAWLSRIKESFPKKNCEPKISRRRTDHRKPSRSRNGRSAVCPRSRAERIQATESRARQPRPGDHLDERRDYHHEFLPDFSGQTQLSHRS